MSYYEPYCYKVSLLCVNWEVFGRILSITVFKKTMFLLYLCMSYMCIWVKCYKVSLLRVNWEVFGRILSILVSSFPHFPTFTIRLSYLGIHGSAESCLCVVLCLLVRMGGQWTVLLKSQWPKCAAPKVKVQSSNLAKTNEVNLSGPVHPSNIHLLLGMTRVFGTQKYLCKRPVSNSWRR